MTFNVTVEQIDSTKIETQVTIGLTVQSLKDDIGAGDNTVLIYLENLKSHIPIVKEADLLFIREDSQLKIIEGEDSFESLVKQANEKKQDYELREEAEWIFHNVFEGNVDTMTFSSTVPKIIYVLKFLKRDNFEVPYIHMYKKDYYAPELKLSDLWEIFDWDEKWEHLQYRKSILYQKYIAAGVPPEFFTLLEESQKELEVQDLMDHFILHYGDASETMQKRKRAIKRDIYRTCKKNGLLDLTKKFGLSAAQLGENMSQLKMVHTPSNSPFSPLESASNFHTAELRTSELVLQCARSAIAQEIAHDPRVRQSLRPIYEKNIAEISTFPTPKGKKEVDAFHPYRIVLRIDCKPPQAFQSVQFLTILKAQKEGFIILKVGTTKEYHEENLKEMENLYLSNDEYDADNEVVREWNEERRKILHEALTNYLYPQFEKELIQTLTEQARERVAVAASEEYTERLMQGPFQPPEDPYHQVPEEVVVLSCICGVGREPTFCVIVDTNGMPKAHMKIYNLDKEKDELSNFIMDHTPHVIAVGASLESRRLYKIVCNVKEANNLRELHVTYVDTEVARIFQDSPRARSEFPDLPSSMRQAICLGRYLQDPLTELSAMAAANEVLCMNLHMLQDMVGADYLNNILQRCVINVVNSVGVDLNRAVRYKYKSPLLQFVAGMGPRKAVDLIQKAQRRGGNINSREDLEQWLSPCIFTNAAGFLRILKKYAVHEWTPLDDTRIHPDDYLLVEKMAKDALETNKKKVIRLMQDPKKLDDVDLDEFAEELRRKGKPKKRSILYDIKQEVNHPFQDPRAEYRDPTPEQLYVMLTGESDNALQQGQLVNARIVSVDERDVRCRLDSGLPAIVRPEDISDSVSLAEVELQPGDAIVGRVKQIDKEKLEAILTCRSSDLQSPVYDGMRLEHLKNIEPYLKVEPDLETEAEHPKEAPSRQRRKLNVSRSKPVGRKIDHPLFSNLSYREAENHLRDQTVGEVVIRPSSQGMDHLTITWKFYDDIFVHINVREENKLNPQSIGRTLWIEEEKFEDLDEILSRYIEPMTNFVQEMVSFRRYQNASENEITEMLRREKEADRKRIPYYITLSHEHPGRFVLYYLPNQTTKHEYISVTPKGFRFRGRVHSSAERMMTWFKTHWKDPLPRERPRRHNPPPSHMAEESDQVTFVESSSAPYQDSSVITVQSGWGQSSSSSSSWGQNAASKQPSFSSTSWGQGTSSQPSSSSSWGQGGGSSSGWSQPSSSSWGQNSASNQSSSWGSSSNQPSSSSSSSSSWGQGGGSSNQSSSGPNQSSWGQSNSSWGSSSNQPSSSSSSWGQGGGSSNQSSWGQSNSSWGSNQQTSSWGTAPPSQPESSAPSGNPPSSWDTQPQRGGNKPRQNSSESSWTSGGWSQGGW